MTSVIAFSVYFVHVGSKQNLAHSLANSYQADRTAGGWCLGDDIWPLPLEFREVFEDVSRFQSSHRAGAFSSDQGRAYTLFPRVVEAIGVL